MVVEPSSDTSNGEITNDENSETTFESDSVSVEVNDENDENFVTVNKIMKEIEKSNLYFYYFQNANK